MNSYKNHHVLMINFVEKFYKYKSTLIYPHTCMLYVISLLYLSYQGNAMRNYWFSKLYLQPAIAWYCFSENQFAIYNYSLF